jgi:predicted transcriptional regulator of viral defense system
MGAFAGAAAHLKAHHRPMPVVRQVLSEGWTKPDAERLRHLAERQIGVVSRRQLRSHGLTDAMVARWLHAGRLYRIHRHVYAIGHRALPLEGRIHAALLYAGPAAALSHTTAAWAWRLVDVEPTRIHLTVPGRRRSLPEVRIHHSRQFDALHCRGFPVTSVARTLVDIADVLARRQLRRALAEADYRGLLDPAEVRTVLRRGRAGSRALRKALANHLPQLAETLSALEERFLELCESAGLPQPEVNGKVGRMRVDALWREQQVAVELDGAAAHAGWAAIKRDRQRELALRARGFLVVRYTWDQLTDGPEEVLADLRQLL